ncbi:hydrogen peroxide-dependent heme synthase [Agromyces aerolatus]|uniref:hydrogen peroxide-dependent heme synthase n=1 Tax=Agromyces sp. LY-1074 TaxID=3074080 RepID=UPI00285EB9DA|nr:MULTISPECIES: hydrogen peroxide-dependent heme synthase [unclassified Agromyces]MDR5701519.1 chlorite dismutase family protein [Agromyces sp. LY-1074]MDR5707874.1 chlorite dismutase family protein [Agromyces sp. LY-1358]
MSSPAAEAAADELRPESEPEQSPEGYTLFAVLRRDPARPDDLDGHDVPRVVDELDGVIATVEAEGVVVRGLYDVSGLRADADLMIWLHGATPEGLQWALRQLRRARLLRALLPTWNAMGVHRDAEFNKAHVPGFLRGIEPKSWLTVYPFNRSYDWYLLDPAERSRMLAEHGRKGAAFRGVIANTVASFALGDYEWLLPLEADELTELVDLMRDLRATDARLHVREEIPFFTGRRVTSAEVVEVLQ